MQHLWCRQESRKRSLPGTVLVLHFFFSLCCIGRSQAVTNALSEKYPAVPLWANAIIHRQRLPSPAILPADAGRMAGALPPGDWPSWVKAPTVFLPAVAIFYKRLPRLWPGEALSGDEPGSWTASVRAGLRVRPISLWKAPSALRFQSSSLFRKTWTRKETQVVRVSRTARRSFPSRGVFQA